MKRYQLLHTKLKRLCGRRNIRNTKASRHGKGIDLIIDNKKNRYYGVTPLCPTGLTLWGRAIAMAGVGDSYGFGDFLKLTPLLSKKNRAMGLHGKEIFAFDKQVEAGDLESPGGASGTNNYNHFWHNKRLYITK